MAFLDKLGGVARNIGDKTSEVAKNLGDKAGDAFETGKWNNKIKAERADADEALRQIGAHYFNQYLASHTCAPEVEELCKSVKAHYDAIEEAQAEIDKIRAESEEKRNAAKEAKEAKGAAAEPADEEPIYERICPRCKAVVGPTLKFCGQCGQQME